MTMGLRSCLQKSRDHLCSDHGQGPLIFYLYVPCQLLVLDKCEEGGLVRTTTTTMMTTSSLSCALLWPALLCSALLVFVSPSLPRTTTTRRGVAIGKVPAEQCTACARPRYLSLLRTGLYLTLRFWGLPQLSTPVPRPRASTVTTPAGCWTVNKVRTHGRPRARDRTGEQCFCFSSVAAPCRPGSHWTWRGQARSDRFDKSDDGEGLHLHMQAPPTVRATHGRTPASGLPESPAQVTSGSQTARSLLTALHPRRLDGG
jgi:hypothetical protein